MGLLMVILGLAFDWAVYEELRKGVDDTVQIKAKEQDSDSYAQWVDTRDPRNPVKTWRVRFYNITNIDAVVAGTTPYFTETLPYWYREDTLRFNVSFANDYSTVSYKEQTMYAHVPDQMDPSLSYNDKIVNVWVGALGFLNNPQVGGSFDNLNVALLAGFLGQSVNILGTGCGAAGAACCSEPQECQMLAVAHWGSGSALGPLLPAGTSFVSNPTFMNIISQVGGDLAINAESYTNIYNFNKTSLFPEYSVWAKANGLPDSALLSPGQAAGLLFGSQFNSSFPGNGLTGGDQTDLVRLGLFLFGFYSEYPLTPDQGHGFYLFLNAVKSFVFPGIAKTAGQAHPGSLLFVARRPDEWLWNYRDPLLTWIGKDPNSAIFRSNYSNTDEAAAAVMGPWELYTGQSDPQRSQEVKRWQGFEMLPNGTFWCTEPTPVGGHYNKQFFPGTNHPFSFSNGVGSNSKLPLWVPELFRMGELTYVKDSNVKGIDSLRFHIGDESLAPNPIYSMQYSGVIDQHCPLNGVPISLTLPHFLRATNLTGANSSTQLPVSDRVLPTTLYEGASDDYEALLDIDPVSGATLRGYLRLQVNARSNLPTSGGAMGKLLPVLWVEEFSELTDKQASDYKGKVYFAMKLHKSLFWGLVVIGVILASFAIGAGVYVGRKRENSETTLQYKNVYEESMLHPDLQDQDDA